MRGCSPLALRRLIFIELISRSAGILRPQYRMNACGLLPCQSEHLDGEWGNAPATNAEEYACPGLIQRGFSVNARYTFKHLSAGAEAFEALDHPGGCSQSISAQSSSLRPSSAP
jgi:hypothetical protein